VPILKNYLSVAYNIRGNIQKSREVNEWLLGEHPDYLFAKLNQAHAWMDQGKSEKVPEILGEAMEIKQLYPERDVFHLAEVQGFLTVAVRYYASIENLELAENRLKILKDISEDEEDAEQAESFLYMLRLKNAANRMKIEKEQQIKPTQAKVKSGSNMTESPQFNHPEISNLYHYGLNIPHEILHEILALPRQTLIADLEMILKDATNRYNHFSKIDFEEETHSFLLHALFLLKEIKSTESFSLILDFLSADYEFINFWLGDHKTESLWQCLYGFGLDNPNIFTDFLLKPDIDTYSKTSFSDALCQMVLHHPEKRKEIIEIYEKVFIRFVNATHDENLIDSDFLALAIGDTIDCRLHELLPIIKTLYDKKYVSLGINGVYSKVEEYFDKPIDFRCKKKICSIFELYDDVIKNWHGYKEENEVTIPKNPVYQQVVSDKIGRNEPCPCGSGKKYKKCCINKN
jgi:hypothetical protein